MAEGKKYGSFIAPCTNKCVSSFQDERYRGNRLFARCDKGGCCTVCGTLRNDTGV